MASDRASVRARLARVVASVVLSSLAMSSVAHAEPTATEKEAARQLMDEGDRRTAARDFAGALEAFARAHALMHVPTTGIELARAEVAVGKLVEARDHALEVARMPGAATEPAAFKKARADASTLAGELGARIPTIALRVSNGHDWSARVSGRPVGDVLKTIPLPVNPGDVPVEISAPGRKTAVRTVAVRERDQIVVEITLEPDTESPAASGIPTTRPSTISPPREPDHTTSPWVFIGYGSAVGFGAVGAITGLISLGKVSDIKKDCEGTSCPPSTEDARSSASTFAWTSNVAFGLAGAGLVVGTIALVSGSPRRSSASAAHVRVVAAPSPRGALVGLDGRF